MMMRTSASQSLVPPTTNKPSQPPTLAEFKAFHGMVCNPISAQKCVDYFDGCALFADQKDYYKANTTTDLASFDFLRTPIPLNLYSYYALVFFSCTGLLSLLGYTKAHQAQEENDVFTEEATNGTDAAATVVESKCLHNIPGTPSLTVPNHVIRYILDRSTQYLDPPGEMPLVNEVHLIRRFEFEFGPLLSVIMCHFECHGRKYLVEVYAFHHSSTINPMTQIIEYIMVTAQKILLMLMAQTKAKEKQC